jgi:hypothetical protein
MRVFRRSLFVMLALCALAVCHVAAAEERRALIDGREVGDWRAEEATLAPSTVAGEPVLLFTVPVDWHAGEANYPIGWPRISLTVPPDQRDWRGWEQLRLRVRAHSSAGSLPFRPLGITISSGSQRISWEEEVPALPVGQWREFTFDVRKLPDPSDVRAVGVYISEDKYADKTTLEFAIARLELVRYSEPTLVDLRPLAAVAFADARSLPLRVTLLGLRDRATAPVELRLMRGGAAVAARQAQAEEGETPLSFSLPADLSPGEYTLSGTAGGRTLSAPVKLVVSPWQEVK